MPGSVRSRLVAGTEHILRVLAQTSTEPDPLEEFLVEYGIYVGLVVLVVLMIFALLTIYKAIHAKERIVALARIAQHHGWRFSTDAVAGANTDLPFDTFKRGDGRGTANVLIGEIDGHEARVFDFWWYVEQKDSYSRSRNGGTGFGVGAAGAFLGEGSGGEQPPSRRYNSLTCAIISIDNVLPHLIIGRENRATRALGAMGARDLQLESEEFNRTFHITCDDQRFATAFLDAGMQDFMIQAGGKFTFEARGRWLLIAHPPCGAKETAAMMPLIAAYRRRVPRIIDDLFPPIIAGTDL